LGGKIMAGVTPEKLKIHWEKTRKLTWLVLIIWAIFSLVIPGFAKDLNSMYFIGFPLGFYFCAQGSLIVFVLLIFFQNWKQDAIDDEAGVGE
jgi:putative solute:sodium symporter small subunit